MEKEKSRFFFACCCVSGYGYHSSLLLLQKACLDFHAEISGVTCTTHPTKQDDCYERKCMCVFILVEFRWDEVIWLLCKLLGCGENHQARMQKQAAVEAKFISGRENGNFPETLWLFPSLSPAKLLSGHLFSAGYSRLPKIFLARENESWAKSNNYENHCAFIHFPMQSLFKTSKQILHAFQHSTKKMTKITIRRCDRTLPFFLHYYVF